MKHSIRALCFFFPLSFSIQSFSLTADQMVDLAISNNQKFQATEAKIRASEYAHTSRSAALRPQVSLSARHQYLDNSQLDDMYNSSQASVTVRQSIFNRTLSTTTHISDIDIQRNILQREQQLQTLLKDLSDLYLDYTDAQEQLVIISNETSRIKRLLRTEEARFEAGASSEVQRSQVKASYLQSRAKEVSQQSTLASATDLLVSTLGSNGALPEPKKANQLKLTLPAGDERNWVNSAMANNYDLRISQLELQTIRAQIAISKGDNYPNLSVFGSYTWNRNNMAKNETSNNERAVGIELSWTIYGGGATTSQVNQYEENYNSSQLNIEYQQKNIADRVRHYWRTLRASQTVIAANVESVISAQRAYEASKISFEAGTLTYADMQSQQNNFVSSARSLRTANYDFMRNVMNLYYKSGKLDRSTFITIISDWIDI